MAFILVDGDDITFSNLLGDKLERVQEFLRDRGCFVPAFSGMDAYAVQTYIRHYIKHQTQAVFLIDRNIYSDVLEIAKGGRITEESKTAAALMAFAPCASAVIEPVLAMHEGASSGAKGGWKRDITLFRAADKIHPVNWAMLTLGEASCFSKKIPMMSEDEPVRSFSPKLKLRSFGFNYPILLKLATLAKRGGDRNFRMLEFFEWMYWNWHFSAPATVLATIVFGAEASKPIFKRIESKDRKAALNGVRNAAWDMVYVQEWFIRARDQAESNTLHILCSRDKLLIKVAASLQRHLFEPIEMDEELRRLGFSRAVAERYRERIISLSSSERKMVPTPKHFEAYRQKIITALEDDFTRA